MSYLIFNQKISNQKPNTIRNKKIKCPFCNRSELATTYKEDGEILMVANKFPTIEDADMFVVIETATCNENVFNYSIEKYQHILEFTVTTWLEMCKDGKYTDVILHKNFGPLSGGSIKHEHMQIVGFTKQVVYEQLSIEQLLGVEVLTDDVIIRISDRPINNYLEYNIEFNLNNIDKLALYLQKVITYLKEKYKLAEFSYNLFFYEFNGRLFVKVVSRYAMSPLFLGYKLQQCYNEEHLLEFRDDLLEYINQ